MAEKIIKNTLLQIPIFATTQLAQVRQKTRELSISIGFTKQQAEEVGLAAYELVTNLINHAQKGHIVISSIHTDIRQGIQIETFDQGFGIINSEYAFKSGYSTNGTLGIGFSIINQFMDQINISSGASWGNGAHIICRRWVSSTKPKPPSLEQMELMVDVSTRPHPSYSINGDAFIIKRYEHALLLSVIDGLGHGQAAHEAAETARSYVETHAYESLDSIMQGTHRACLSTRGVVMALIYIDLLRCKLHSLNIGNVIVEMYDNTQHKIIRLPYVPGVLGLEFPQTSPTAIDWNMNSVLLIYSDGISPQWKELVANNFHLINRQQLSYFLLKKYAKNDDDATMLVVRKVP